MTAAREIMTSDAVCVGGNETLADAARKLRDLEVRRLPVIDGRRPIGMQPG